LWPLSLSRARHHTQIISHTIHIHGLFDLRDLPVVGCLFERCHGDKEGVISGLHVNLTVADTSFISNSARIASTLHVLRLGFISFVRLLVLDNSADYDGEIAADSEHGGNYPLVEPVNVCANSAAKWTDGLSLDHPG
jgi:hypothetical protein